MRWLRGLKQAPITVVLMVINVLVYAIMAGLSGHLLMFDNETLLVAGACAPGAHADLSHWRWITAAFIHVHLAHIFMNMWVLAQIGAISEQALGRGLFAATYVVTGLFGNVLSAALTSYDHRSISAGASGAIMGLIGLAATFAWRSGQRAIAKALAFNILFVLGIGLSLTAGGVRLVDNAAHIGGLVVGAIIGLARVSVRRPTSPVLDRVLVAASFTVVALAFLIVQLTGG
jgi:rhomboid protease GluP